MNNFSQFELNSSCLLSFTYQNQSYNELFIQKVKILKEDAIDFQNCYNYTKFVPVAQRIEHAPSKGGMRVRFSPGTHLGPVAQLAEQYPLKVTVGGSSPPRLTSLT